MLLKTVQMVITGWKDGKYRKKFVNCTGQATTLVNAHRHINYLLSVSDYRRRREEWLDHIQLVCLTFTHKDSAKVS